jgi:protein-disulfide isomerase
MARQEAGVDQPIVGQCIAMQDDRRIKASIAEGDKLGVQNLPTLFVNGEKLVGVPPVESIWAAIDRALKSQGIAPPK